MKTGFFVFLLLFCKIVIAQSVSGVVRDAETEQRMLVVNVYIPELGKGVVTNGDGEYEIANMPKGTFKIQFSFIGYETLIQTVKIENEEVFLDVSLWPSVVETHEIVISAAYQTSQDENPVKVEQLSVDEINRSGASTLMEALSNIAGVEQVSTGVGIGKPVIRGLSYNRVLVYSMGVRIENQQWGDEHGLGMNEMGIERVEIIKGPSSLLYGSEAMGGVMHLISEKPANTGTLVGEYNVKLFSNTLGASSNLGVKGTGKTFRFSIRAGHQSHADYQTGTKERVTNSRFNESSIKSSVGMTKKWISSTFSHNYINSNVGIPEEIGKQTTSRKQEFPHQTISSHLFSSQNTLFLGNAKLKSNFGYMTNNRKEFEEPEFPDKLGQAELYMQTSTFNYDLKWYFPPSERAEYIVGVQGHDQWTGNAGAEVLVPDALISELGAVGMAKYNLKKLTLQLGARYDVRKIDTKEMGVPLEAGYMPALDLDFGSLNGSFGGSFHLNKKLLFRFNAASGYRAPNLAELASNGVHSGTSRYEIGNANLKNEQNYEVDVSSHFHSKHATADVAVFYNTISNYIFIGPTDSLIESNQVYTYVQENAVLYGGEATLDIHPHPLDWLHLEVSYSMVIGDRSDGSSLPLIPANKVRTTVKTELKDWKFLEQPYVHVNVVSAFAQNRVSEFETATGGYNLVNAGMGAKINLGKQQVDLSFSVSNVLNTAYYDHLSRLKYDGIYNIGRNFVLGLRVPINPLVPHKRVNG